MGKGISISEENLGDTIIPDLENTHRDACDLKYKTIGDIAEIILSELIGNERYRRFTKSEVKKALVEAYCNNRIAAEKCTPSLLGEIQKAAGL